MKKLLIYLVFIAICGFLGYELYQLNLESVEAQKELDGLNSEKEALLQDSDRLKTEIDFFKDPHNLEKELRARFNVRLPDEKLIIIIPQDQRTGE